MTAASATPGADRIVKALGTGKIANGWIDETAFFATIVDATFAIVGSVDDTKKFAVQADTQATASTLTLDVGAQTTSRTLTIPVLAADATIAVIGQTQAFTGVQTFADTTEATGPTVAAVPIAGGLGVVKRSFLGTIAGSFKGNVIAGTQDGTADVAGQVGETLSSTVTAVAAAATTVTSDVTSLTLTPGVWMINAQVNCNAGTTGLANSSISNCSIVTTSATNGTIGDTMLKTEIFALKANALLNLAAPFVTVNISASTTYYLTASVTYAGGSPTYDGKLTATRIR